jgi:hypothetical protein
MFKFFKVPLPSDEGRTPAGENRLHKYIQAQSVQDMAQLAAGIGPEVKQIIAMNVQALLGYLPSGDFQTSITTSKENLQNLLASSMLTGYFMHALEYRMLMDKLMQDDEPESAAADHLMAPEDLFAQLLEEAIVPDPQGRFLSADDLRAEVAESPLPSSEEIAAEVEQSGLFDDDDETA